MILLVDIDEESYYSPQTNSNASQTFNKGLPL